jgi:hypothetical protein
MGAGYQTMIDASLRNTMAEEQDKSKHDRPRHGGDDAEVDTTGHLLPQQLTPMLDLYTSLEAS